MINPRIVLTGFHVRLEPLTEQHIEGLAEAVAENPSLYRWSSAPQHPRRAKSYVRRAIWLRQNGAAVPFAIIRCADDRVIGSARFWNIEYWHSTDDRMRDGCDICEIGTWLAPSAIRTAANTETKFMMLAHAFEIWRVARVCFYADVRNERSCTALTRLGATFEGVFRAHRLAPDSTPRDSAGYSIIASEWPDLKRALRRRLQMREGGARIANQTIDAER